MPKTKRVMVSVPYNLLQEVDGIVSSEKRNRSEFIREAMRLYIRERKKNEIREKMQKGYKEMGKINLDLANEALEAENEANKIAEEMVSGA